MNNLSLALLFPKARPSSVSTTSVASMIARTIDSIPRDFANVTANPIECLLFPLKSIIAHTSGYKLSEKLRCYTVSDLYDYHPVGHFIKPKAPNDIDYDIRFVARKFFKATFDGRCTTHPFFHRCLSSTSLNTFNPSDAELILSQLDFLPFKQGLHIQAFDSDNLECKSPAKFFRATITAHSLVHLHQAQASSSVSWSKF